MSPLSFSPTARVLVAPGKLMAVKVKDPLAEEAEVSCADAGWESSPNWRARMRPAIRTPPELYLEASNKPDRFIFCLPQLDIPGKRVRQNLQSAVRSSHTSYLCFHFCWGPCQIKATFVSRSCRSFARLRHQASLRRQAPIGALQPLKNQDSNRPTAGV